MSRYTDHLIKWKDCKLCKLCETRNKVVLVRLASRVIPAEVCFVGEGPGPSEDILGEPFVGPAGHLLDGIISKGLPPEWSYCLTNLVACIPVDEENDKKFTEPPAECVKACTPRLHEFLYICKPQLIVCVGKAATKYLSQSAAKFNWDTPSGPVQLIEIMHPAHILRLDISQRGLAIQRCVVALSDAVSELVPF